MSNLRSSQGFANVGLESLRFKGVTGAGILGVSPQGVASVTTAPTLESLTVTGDVVLSGSVGMGNLTATNLAASQANIANGTFNTITVTDTALIANLVKINQVETLAIQQLLVGATLFSPLDPGFNLSVTGGGVEISGGDLRLNPSQTAYLTNITTTTISASDSSGIQFGSAALSEIASITTQGNITLETGGDITVTDGSVNVGSNIVIDGTLDEIKGLTDLYVTNIHEYTVIETTVPTSSITTSQINSVGAGATLTVNLGSQDVPLIIKGGNDTNVIDIYPEVSAGMTIQNGLLSTSDAWINYADQGLVIGPAGQGAAGLRVASDGDVAVGGNFAVGTTGSTTVMYVEVGTGNVGIGTENPQATLDVNGTGNFSVGITIADVLAIGATNSATCGYFSANNDIFMDTAYAGDRGLIVTNSLQDTGLYISSGEAGDYTFLQVSNAGGGNSANTKGLMIQELSPSGPLNTIATFQTAAAGGGAPRVGINTSNPLYTLDVNGTGHFTQTVNFDANINGSNGLQITAGGGITITPETSVQYPVNVALSEANQAFTMTTTLGTTVNNLFAAPYVGGNGYNGLTKEGDAVIAWDAGTGHNPPSYGLVVAPHSAAAGGIRIDSDGNLGVGVATPQGKLHVGWSNNQPIEDWMVSSTNNGNFNGWGYWASMIGKAMKVDNTGTVTVYGDGEGAAYGSAISISSSGIDFLSTYVSVPGGGTTTATFNDVFKMRLTNDGKLGIGVQSPESTLDVSGTGHFSGGVTFDTTINVANHAIMQNDLMFIPEGTTVSRLVGNSGIMYYESLTKSLFTQLYSGSDSALSVVHSTNQVGINNDYPTYTLDVNGTGHFTSNFTIGGVLKCLPTLSLYIPLTSNPAYNTQDNYFAITTTPNSEGYYVGPANNWDYGGGSYFTTANAYFNAVYNGNNVSGSDLTNSAIGGVLSALVQYPKIDIKMAFFAWNNDQDNSASWNLEFQDASILDTNVPLASCGQNISIIGQSRNPFNITAGQGVGPSSNVYYSNANIIATLLQGQNYNNGTTNLNCKLNLSGRLLGAGYIHIILSTSG